MSRHDNLVLEGILAQSARGPMPSPWPHRAVVLCLSFILVTTISFRCTGFDLEFLAAISRHIASGWTH